MKQSEMHHHNFEMRWVACSQAGKRVSMEPIAVTRNTWRPGCRRDAMPPNQDTKRRED